MIKGYSSFQKLPGVVMKVNCFDAFLTKVRPHLLNQLCIVLNLFIHHQFEQQQT